ncbi:uncharacterized protein [Dysidea avara]|uniref:uncharacterized protein isoform X2 n=1 Tax=Dysidea avara TaxID=196820 RepID=UPI00332503DC
MADKQSIHRLVEHREELANTLDPHVDSLVQKFSDMKLLSHKDTANLEAKPKQDKLRVNFFLDIVHDKMENNDSKSYDELITFMKKTEEYTSLTNLANKMTNPEEVPFGHPVESESSSQVVQELLPPQYSHQVSQEMVTSSTSHISSLQCNGNMSTEPVTPTETTAPDVTDEGDLLKGIAERKSNVVKVRYSTVLCTGEPKAGKTKFCKLLMNKTTQSPGSGDYHTVFVKKHGESSWMEINLEHLEILIDQINQKQCPTKPTTAMNSKEMFDILILLDINVPSSTICLLQPAIVTFVTYKLRGQEDGLCARSHQFIKELMSTNCFGKKFKFDELEIAGNPEKAFYTAFVGTRFDDDNSLEMLYHKEATKVNENVQNLKAHINCSVCEIPLSLWYNKDSYLHVVNLESNEDENISLIRDRLEETVSQNSIHQIPVSWVILSLKIQKFCHEQKAQYLEYRIVFEEIWKTECKMYSEPELKLALKFFHHHGVLFHFDTVEGARDFVFTRCCWMFDKLKYLLTGFKDKERNYDAKELLMKEGRLNTKMVREIEFDGPGKMTLTTFINLLEHLKFVAKVNQTEYFMPSILESYENKKGLFDSYGNKCHDALSITFLSGSLHRSVFCFLAAYILTNMPDKWSKPCYDEQTGQQYTFKDMITFSIGVDNHVCIIDKVFSLEVQIYTTDSKGCDQVLHIDVFRTIKEALGDVCKSLEIPPEDCKYGFLCTKCNSNDHLMILKDFNERHAYCSKSNRALHLSDHHIVWLEVNQLNQAVSPLHEQATTDSDAVTDGSIVLPGARSYVNEDFSYRMHTDGTPTSARRLSDPGETEILGKGSDCPTLRLLHRFKKEISKNWFDLGVELINDSANELNNLQENHPKDAEKCCSKMFQLWLKKCSEATWNQLIKALRVPGIEMFELANKIESMLLMGVFLFWR